MGFVNHQGSVRERERERNKREEREITWVW